LEIVKIQTHIRLAIFRTHFSLYILHKFSANLSLKRTLHLIVTFIRNANGCELPIIPYPDYSVQ